MSKTGDEASEPEGSEIVEKEPDLLPEYCRYRDTGCEFCESCLGCTFPQCLYDEPRGRQRWLKEMRNKEVNRLFSDGWRLKELASLFGVSRRTVQRALKCTVSVSSWQNNGNTAGGEGIYKGEQNTDE